MRLSFHRIYTSGLFYRAYEWERAGNEIDLNFFSEEAERRTDGKTYRIEGVNKRITIDHIKNRIAKDYKKDYLRWKLAFPH